MVTNVALNYCSSGKANFIFFPPLHVEYGSMKVKYCSTSAQYMKQKQTKKSRINFAQEFSQIRVQVTMLSLSTINVMTLC